MESLCPSASRSVQDVKPVENGSGSGQTSQSSEQPEHLENLVIRAVMALESIAMNLEILIEQDLEENEESDIPRYLDGTPR